MAAKGGLSEYEQQRLQKIAENRKRMNDLNIMTLARDVQTTPSKPKSTARKRKSAAPTPVPTVSRRSLRSRGLDPDGVAVETAAATYAQAAAAAHEEKYRRPEGDLDLSPADDDISAEDNSAFIKLMKQATEATRPSTHQKKGSKAKGNTTFVNLTMSQPSGTKVVPERIMSLRFVDCDSRLLLATGDKTGRLGILNCGQPGDETSQDPEETLPSFTYKHHSRPLSCIVSPASTPWRMFTCSYDNSIRVMDLNAEKSLEVFVFNGSDDRAQHGMSFVAGSSDVLLSCDGKGYVNLIDTRSAGRRGGAEPSTRGLTGSDPDGPSVTKKRSKTLRGSRATKTENEEVKSDDVSEDDEVVSASDSDSGTSKGAQHTWILHQKKVGSVHCHPVNPHLFVTASNDNTVCLWDQRKIKGSTSCLGTMSHSRAVTSAYFSPNGEHILSTSYDDTLGIWSFAGKDSAASQETAKVKAAWADSATRPMRVRHNNQTGRWVTNFKAEWSPQGDYFVVGGMGRTCDLYSFEYDRSSAKASVEEYEKSHEYLTAIPACNAFHPRLNYMGSATASGKLYLWHPQK